MSSIKWVVELPFNVHMLYSTRYSPLRKVKNLLHELHTPLSFATLVYYDSVSAIYVSSNLVLRQYTKHIEIDIHFGRDLVAVGHVQVLHVPSRYQDGENLDKMKEKGDECIFVGYSTQSRAYRVFNKRTRVIMESIHVNFDELPHMASNHISSDPVPKYQRMALEHDSLSPVIQRQENVPQADRTVTSSNELDLLFSLMFDELLNRSSKVVSKSSAVSSADAPNQHQTKYRSKVGALMYLTASRPDIMHATCYCARYQAQPTDKHLTAVKRIFRYLKDTIHMGLWYPKDTSFELTAFSNLDHAGYLDSRKSTSGGIQFLGCDKLVSWSSKKQDYYGFHFDKIPMYCDSKAAITISCNPVQHSCTKHIDVRYHFIKEKVEKGMVELFFVRTEYQLADLFNKALPEKRFKYLVKRLGMRCLTPEKLEALANASA
nr:retrovirus-related Pol polyprotein from transposon TNT 1-94 [Tanacetum cinerariifolium]